MLFLLLKQIDAGICALDDAEEALKDEAQYADALSEIAVCDSLGRWSRAYNY